MPLGGGVVYMPAPSSSGPPMFAITAKNPGGKVGIEFVCRNPRSASHFHKCDQSFIV